ncbi:MAG: HAD family hydrolase [Anaerolineae bacterium]
MPIKAITFDFWATLYRPKTVDYTQRLLRMKEIIERGTGHRYDMEEFQLAVKLARDTWSRTWREEQRTMSAAEWLGVMQRGLGASLPVACLAELETMMENSVLEDLPTLTTEAAAVLAALSPRYRLGLISDTGITPGRVLRQILEQDQLSDYFIHLTFSDEVGRSKPHPSAFLTTLTALNATPVEAVHIGDLLRTDIAGAQAVGMRAVQYIGISHDLGEELNGATVTPDAVIRSHEELEPLLKQWI